LLELQLLLAAKEATTTAALWFLCDCWRGRERERKRLVLSVV